MLAWRYGNGHGNQWTTSRSVKWQAKPNLEFRLQITPHFRHKLDKMTHNCALRDPPFLFLCIIYDSFVSEWYGPFDYCSYGYFHWKQHSLFLWLSVLIYVYVYVVTHNDMLYMWRKVNYSFFFIFFFNTWCNLPFISLEPLALYLYFSFFYCSVVISTVLQSQSLPLK